jgi:hypothetical protein
MSGPTVLKNCFPEQSTRRSSGTVVIFEVFLPPDIPPEHAFDVLETIRFPYIEGRITFSDTTSSRFYVPSVLHMHFFIQQIFLNAHVPEEHQVGRNITQKKTGTQEERQVRGDQMILHFN